MHLTSENFVVSTISILNLTQTFSLIPQFTEIQAPDVFHSFILTVFWWPLLNGICFCFLTFPHPVLKGRSQTRLTRFCQRPSLNTQSCIRRPLCSTFRFENLSISPKKKRVLCFRGKKKINEIITSFYVTF